jgi:peptidyl-prolyl cis-trans isomerase A (cyclophilin A)
MMLRRRQLMIGAPALLVAGGPSYVPVRVETELGPFTIAVYPQRAPITATNFLAYVDRGLLAGGSVYRIVSPSNESPAPAAPISVIQWGLHVGRDVPPLPPIVHESTEQTGLRHRHGTVSMARFEPGTAAADFFVCIGDQPELDCGGRRNPDGAGFAAFGDVVAGGDTIDRIYARAEAAPMLVYPIALRRVVRV